MANKTLAIFSNGDPFESSTWSNVPYMFISSFKRLRPSVDLRCCNIRLEDGSLSLRFLSKVWRNTVTRLTGDLNTFDRSRLYRHLVLRKMRMFSSSLSGGCSSDL